MQVFVWNLGFGVVLEFVCGIFLAETVRLGIDYLSSALSSVSLFYARGSDVRLSIDVFGRVGNGPNTASMGPLIVSADL